MEKIGIAISWAAACGGCDVSILDVEEDLLDLAEIANIVYWPVAIDLKRDSLEARPDGSVDFGLFNGAIRTDEQEEDAKLFRRKCKVLVAWGSCACFGGIPGLANLADRETLLDVAYRDTASTENPDDLRPEPKTEVDGRELTLPALFDAVKSLPQVVPTDLFLPGCPPPVERIRDVLGAAARYASEGELPASGHVFASDKALCDECPRGEGRKGGRIEKIVRPHEAPDTGDCFLDQGILCLGIGTRGGCGAGCVEANMPCRGCFGPTPGQLDPAAEILSALGSVAGAANENDVPPHEMKAAIRSIRDAVGTFYRFTLPSAFLDRAVEDEPLENRP